MTEQILKGTLSEALTEFAKFHKRGLDTLVTDMNTRTITTYPIRAVLELLKENPELDVVDDYRIFGLGKDTHNLLVNDPQHKENLLSDDVSTGGKRVCYSVRRTLKMYSVLFPNTSSTRYEFATYGIVRGQEEHFKAKHPDLPVNIRCGVLMPVFQDGEYLKGSEE